MVFPELPESPIGSKALQQAFFDLGFVRAKEHTLQELSVVAGPEPAVSVVPRLYRTFADLESRFVFSLTTTSLVLHTSAYTGHEAFFSRFREGLEALVERFPVPCADRVGLRYIDLVQFESSHALRTLITPALLGFPFRAHGIAGTGGAFATNTMANTDIGVLSLRSTVVGPGQYLPPDLNADGVQRPEKVDPTLPGIILDFDHFTVFADRGESPLAPNPDGIVQHLDRLHASIRTVFRAAVTTDALAAWGLLDAEVRA